MSLAVLDAPFQYLSDVSGLPLDQSKLIGLQLVSYPFVVLQRQLPAGTPRHLFSVLLGLLWCWICFGSDTYHLLLSSGVSYLLMRVLPPNLQATVTFVWMFGYMSCASIWSVLFNYLGWTMDYTGALMILTVKITWLALNLHDGRKPPDAKHSPDNRRDLIPPELFPSLLEWFSYSLWFPTVLCGPAFPFRGFRDWSNDSGAVRSGRWFAAMCKFIACVLLAAAFAAGSDLLPTSYIVAEPPAPSIGDLSVMGRLHYVAAAIVVYRMKFFFVWYMSDACCIIGGFGFNGKAAPVAGNRVTISPPASTGVAATGRVLQVDSARGEPFLCRYTSGPQKGEESWIAADRLTVAHGPLRRTFECMFGDSVDSEGFLWNRCSNGKYFEVELALNPKGITDNWNVGVSSWLYNAIYVRLSKRFGAQPAVLMTQTVSAFWHGFYPGYYLFFASTAVYVQVARMVRRSFRPLALAGGKTAKRVYDIVGWWCTAVGINCLGVPFVFLRVDHTWRVWQQLYFLPHLAVPVLVVLCKLAPCPKARKKDE